VGRWGESVLLISLGDSQTELPTPEWRDFQTAKAVGTSNPETIVGVSGKEISSVVLHGVFFVGSSAALARMQRSFYFLFRLMFVQYLSM
jgi:hypothetical protein